MNKWKNAALPAILLLGSAGMVYSWSLLVKPIAEYINRSQTEVQFAFSLAIFFLGMSAAFGGSIVERNVHKSSFLGAVLFCSGLTVTAVAMEFKSLTLLYIGFGVILGTGTGISYLSPVKTLMLWFKDNKGLATGISVCAFGFASTIASPIITYLTSRYSLQRTFVTLSCIYFIPMIAAHLLLKKPEGWVEPQTKSNFDYKGFLTDKRFIAIWIFFFLNITCGLALIPIASPMLTELNFKSVHIALVVSIMGVFNGAGRLAFAAMSDKLRKRITMYYVVFVLSTVTVIMALAVHSLSPFMLIIISSCYGAGFALLPSLVSDIWGMKNISKQHGTILSAWSIAGLCGNQLSMFIQKHTGSYLSVLYVLAVLYMIAFCFSLYIGRRTNNDSTRT